MNLGSIASGIAIALIALLSRVASAADTPWDRALWDPAPPLEHQLDLPLPCGGAMAFARIETPVDATNPLSDRRIQLGGSNEHTGYLDYFRVDFIRGSFMDGTRVFYYLGKYEVTRDQWSAVMGDCPAKPSRGGSRPQGDLSWFDAVDYSRRLTEWLRAQPGDLLPRVEGVPGYLRLPTEAEWEYAARGGAGVDDANFRAPLPPPMESRIEDYAWFAGPRSANGAFRPVGTKKPNPLGLHDMLGSVEELVLGPFHFNNLGRLHGQAGGFVTRGGSIRTEQGALRSAMRNEFPYFSVTDGQPTRLDTVGLRLAISAPDNTSTARTTAAREAWRQAAAADTAAAGDPLAVIDQMSSQETNKRILEDLAYVRSQILADRRARDEAKERAVRTSLLSGATVMQWLNLENGKIAGLNLRIGQAEEYAQKPAYTAERREQFRNIATQQRQALAEVEQNKALAESVYLATLYDLLEATDFATLEAQANQLTIELANQNNDRLSPFVQLFQANIERKRAQPGLSRQSMLEDALKPTNR